MNPIESKQTYQEYVNKKSPNSPIWKNCFNAFWVGGLICTIGQVILNICGHDGDGLCVGSFAGCRYRPYVTSR